jgi:hypothetical protein
MGCNNLSAFSSGQIPEEQDPPDAKFDAVYV